MRNVRKESILIECDGKRCPSTNIVVNPQIVGNGPLKVGIVGEAPYKDEVEYGEPFIGASGQLLRDYFDLENFTYYIVNTLNCETKKNGVAVKPSEMDIDEFKGRFAKCKPFREQVLDLLDDGSVIMAFGRFAQQSLFNVKVDPSESPFFIEYKDKSFIVYSNYHPSFALIYKPSYKVLFENILIAAGVFAVDL